jgi:type IV secretory pathway VirB2 component (pilin)
LLEAVELAVIGAFASTVALLVVLAVAGLAKIIGVHDLSHHPTAYIKNHPLRLLWLVAVVLVVACGVAYAAARISHLRQAASIRPAGTAWSEAFVRDLPRASDVIRATVELRDGRKIEGTLAGTTAGAVENREIYLAAPLRVQARGGAAAQTLPDRFMLVRENDVLAISGRYIAGMPPPAKASKRKASDPAR